MNTTALMGQGTSVHITEVRNGNAGVICNRVDGTWKAPRPVEAAATCKRCIRIAAREV